MSAPDGVAAAPTRADEAALAAGAGPVEPTRVDPADLAAGPGPVEPTRADPADLAAVAEPVALRDAWWAAERAGEEPPDLVGCVADLAWAAWATRLPGTDRSWLGAVAGGHRRELWLWLAGERTWEQALTSLAGRVRRRLPA